jgi:hypothetical protein
MYYNIRTVIIIINGFYWGQKRFTPTYNGPLTYNNAVRDVTIEQICNNNY